MKAEKERARKALELEARREQGAVSATHNNDDDDVFFLLPFTSTTQVKIQAWWRGIMVRHCLGQFRKNKTLKAKLMKIQKSRK